MEIVTTCSVVTYVIVIQVTEELNPGTCFL